MRWIALLPFVTALVAGVQAQTLAQPSSQASGMGNLLPGTSMASALGAAIGANQGADAQQIGADSNMASAMMGMIGNAANINSSPADMSQYSNHTPVPRWGATATYLQGTKAVLFTGGQTDDQGTITNETLLLDMRGLSNLQLSRVSSRQVPWLHVTAAPHSAAAPSTAYAAGVTSASVCGATDGHIVDTTFLFGGKTDHCDDQPIAWTYAVQRHGTNVTGQWISQHLNHTAPVRRAHAQGVLSVGSLAGENDVGVLVLGGQDRDEVCAPKHHGNDLAASMDMFSIGPVLDAQCFTPNRTMTTPARTYSYKDDLAGVPVTEYAGVQMPLIPNAQTHHDETPFLLLGGRDKNNQLVDFQRPWAIDTTSGKWSQWVTRGAAPSPRVGHSAVVGVNGNVYVYGGYKQTTGATSVSKEPTDEMYMLDASTTPAVWSRIHYRAPPQNGPAPSARAYHSAVMVDDVMIVAFGQQHKRTAYGLERRGGTNVNASEPLVLYLDTREGIMQYRWTDRLSSIVSGRLAQRITRGSTSVQSAQFNPTSTAPVAPTPTAALNYVSKVPTPPESSASVSSASRASRSSSLASVASASSASRASAKSASRASRVSASSASAESARLQSAVAAAESRNAGVQENNHSQVYTNVMGQSSSAQPTSSATSSDGAAATATTAPTDKSSDGSTTHSGAIAGGVIGAAALCVGAVVGGLYAYKKRRESQQIAELRANGVIYGGRKDDLESAPPVSSLWLRRPLKEVVDNNFGRQSNMSAYSTEGAAGSQLSHSPAGGRSLGGDERQYVRGPRSVFPTSDSEYSSAAMYAPTAASPAMDPVSYPADDAHANPFEDGVLRSSGAEMTTNDDVYAADATVPYAHDAQLGASDDELASPHADDMYMRTASSFHLPARQSSQLRVMNN